MDETQANRGGEKHGGIALSDRTVPKAGLAG